MLASQNASKGKGKAREDIIDLTSATESTGKFIRPCNRYTLMKGVDDRLWIDIYEPTTEAELAVHIRKVEDVRRWFTEAFNGGPSGKLKKYRVCSLIQNVISKKMLNLGSGYSS